MALDVYSPCPGGLDKKIKFCCSDLIADLQKLERMLEGEQYVAALQLVERLEATHPDRACLLATKCTLLRELERDDDAAAVARHLLELQPENFTALSEMATSLALAGSSSEALAHLARALDRASGRMLPRLYEAIWDVAATLVMDGHLLAGKMLARMMESAGLDDNRPRELLVNIFTSRQVPLVLKDDWFPEPAPAAAPWRAEYEAAIEGIQSGRWLTPAGSLGELAPRIEGEFPAVWRNLGILRAWLADVPGAAEALRHFAASDVGWDDAVEAEALALSLGRDPFGDQIDIATVSYAVTDLERLEQALLSTPELVAVADDPAALAAPGETPPKMVRMIVDRPPGADDAPFNPASAPRVLGVALLYGRQTDREARLTVIEASTDEHAAALAILRRAAGDALADELERVPTGSTSATLRGLAPRWFAPHAELGRPSADDMAVHQQRYLLEQWIDRPLGALDGQSPRAAAADPAWRVRLAAVVLVIECFLDQTDSRVDLNRLRSPLGLPIPGPIDPQPLVGKRLPLVQLHRVRTDRLSDEELVKLMLRAALFEAQRAQRVLAEAVLARPSLSKRPEALRAYEVLVRLDIAGDASLARIDAGRRLAAELKQPLASWDLIELSVRLRRGDLQDSQRLLGHIQRAYGRDANVMRQLAELLMAFGIINPDGTPAVPTAAAAQPPQPAIVVPGEEAGEPRKLWTPGDAAGGERKLWTPGM